MILRSPPPTRRQSVPDASAQPVSSSAARSRSGSHLSHNDAGGPDVQTAEHHDEHALLNEVDTLKSSFNDRQPVSFGSTPSTAPTGFYASPAPAVTGRALGGGGTGRTGTTPTPNPFTGSGLRRSPVPGTPSAPLPPRQTNHVDLTSSAKPSTTGEGRSFLSSLSNSINRPTTDRANTPSSNIPHVATKPKLNPAPAPANHASSSSSSSTPLHTQRSLPQAAPGHPDVLSSSTTRRPEEAQASYWRTQMASVISQRDTERSKAEKDRAGWEKEREKWESERRKSEDEKRIAGDTSDLIQMFHNIAASRRRRAAERALSQHLVTEFNEYQTHKLAIASRDSRLQQFVDSEYWYNCTVRELKQEIDNLHVEHEGISEKLLEEQQVLTERVEELTAELEESRQAIQELEAGRGNNQSELQRLQKQITTLTTTNSTLEQTKDRLTASLKTTTTSLTSSKSTITQLTDELASLKAELASSRTELKKGRRDEAEVDELMSVKVDLELKVKELEDRVREGLRRERARGKELEGESVKVGELEEQLQEAKMTIRELRSAQRAAAAASARPPSRSPSPPAKSKPKPKPKVSSQSAPAPRPKAKSKPLFLPSHDEEEEDDAEEEEEEDVRRPATPSVSSDDEVVHMPVSPFPSSPPPVKKAKKAPESPRARMKPRANSITTANVKVGPPAPAAKKKNTAAAKAKQVEEVRGSSEEEDGDDFNSIPTKPAAKSKALSTTTNTAKGKKRARSPSADVDVDDRSQSQATQGKAKARPKPTPRYAPAPPADEDDSTTTAPTKPKPSKKASGKGRAADEGPGVSGLGLGLPSSGSRSGGASRRQTSVIDVDGEGDDSSMQGGAGAKKKKRKLGGGFGMSREPSWTQGGGGDGFGLGIPDMLSPIVTKKVSVPRSFSSQGKR